MEVCAQVDAEQELTKGEKFEKHGQKAEAY